MIGHQSRINRNNQSLYSGFMIQYYKQSNILEYNKVKCKVWLSQCLKTLQVYLSFHHSNIKGSIKLNSLKSSTVNIVIPTISMGIVVVTKIISSVDFNKLGFGHPFGPCSLTIRLLLTLCLWCDYLTFYDFTCFIVTNT